MLQSSILIHPISLLFNSYLWQTPAPFDHKSTTMVDFQPKTGDRFPCFKPKPQVIYIYFIFLIHIQFLFFVFCFGNLMVGS